MIEDMHGKETASQILRTNEIHANPDPYLGRGNVLSRFLKEGRFHLPEVNGKEVTIDTKNPLGGGDHGIVLPATRQDSKENIAAKIFLPLTDRENRYGKQTLLEDFEREATLIEMAKHEGFPQFFGKGSITIGTSSSLPFYLRELLPETLANHMQQPMNVDETVRMVKQLSSVLTYAHNEYNTLITDLDPSNIGVRKNGDFVVIDLGSAIKNDEGLIGTSRQYVAPELMLVTSPNQMTDALNPRAQESNVALLAYRALGGIIPSKESRSLGTVNVQLASVPERLQSVLQKGLQFNPQERFSSLEEFSNEFAEAAKG